MSAGLQELLLPREVAAIFRVTKCTRWNWEHSSVLVTVRLPMGQKPYKKEDMGHYWGRKPKRKDECSI